MQYDGWLETMLQARFPKHQLVVRNLGFSGDEIGTRPALEELRHARRVAERPGPARSAATKTIASLAPRRRPTSCSRSSATTSRTPGRPVSRRSRRSWPTGSRTRWRRSTTDGRRRAIVLFSPIAHEDLSNPDLPDGKENNQRLALYTKAMADVARASNITFVDLFTPSTKLYADIKAAAHDPGHPPQQRRQPTDRSGHRPLPLRRCSQVSGDTAHEAASGRRRQGSALVPALPHDGWLRHVRRPRVSDVRSRQPAECQPGSSGQGREGRHPADQLRSPAARDQRPRRHDP